MSPWQQRNSQWNTISMPYDMKFFVALCFLINIVIFLRILLFSHVVDKKIPRSVIIDLSKLDLPA